MSFSAGSEYEAITKKALLPLFFIVVLAMTIALWDPSKFFYLIFQIFVLVLCLTFLRKDEPTSLWNIACAVVLINGLYVLSIAITSRVVFLGRIINIEGTMALKASIVLVLFLIVGKLGYVWGSKLLRGKNIHILNISFQRKVYILLAILVLIPMGLMMRSWLMASKGLSLSVILSAIFNQGAIVTPTDGRLSAGAGVNLSTEGAGYLTIMANLATGGVLLLLMSAKSKKFWRLSCAIALLVLLLYALTGRRTSLVPLLLGIAFSYHYRIRKIEFKNWIISAILIYVVFNVLLIGRIYFSGVHLDKLSSEPLRFFAEDLRFGVGRSADGFFLTIIKADGFEIRPWSFESWYSFIWYPIPRVIFPGKPQHIPVGWEVAKLYVNPSFNLNSSGGVAPTIVTTLYLNAGYLGVVIGATLLGVLLGYLDSCLLKSPTPGNQLIHLIAWVVVFILFRTGDLTSAVIQSITMFGGLVAFVVPLNFFGTILLSLKKREVV